MTLWVKTRVGGKYGWLKIVFDANFPVANLLSDGVRSGLLLILAIVCWRQALYWHIAVHPLGSWLGKTQRYVSCSSSE